MVNTERGQPSSVGITTWAMSLGMVAYLDIEPLFWAMVAWLVRISS